MLYFTNLFPSLSNAVFNAIVDYINPCLGCKAFYTSELLPSAPLHFRTYVLLQWHFGSWCCKPP